MQQGLFSTFSQDIWSSKEYACIWSQIFSLFALPSQVTKASCPSPLLSEQELPFLVVTLTAALTGWSVSGLQTVLRTRRSLLGWCITSPCVHNLIFLVFEFFVARPRWHSFLSAEKAEQIAAARAYALRASLCVAHYGAGSFKISRLHQRRLRGERTYCPVYGLKRGCACSPLACSKHSNWRRQFPRKIQRLEFLLTEGWFKWSWTFYEANGQVGFSQRSFRMPDLSKVASARQQLLLLWSPKVEVTLAYRHLIAIGTDTTLSNIPKDASTADAVGKFEEAKASTSDIYAIEGFDRVIHDLVEGTIDFSDRRSMAEIPLWFAFAKMHNP